MATSMPLATTAATVDTFLPSTTSTFSLDKNTPTVILTPPSSIVTNPLGNGTSGSSDVSGFQTSGGYIYLILFIALIIAAVYFTKAILAKRREKQQLLKEWDCEDPPGYSNHILDMQVLDSSSLNTTPSNRRANRNISPATLPEIPIASHPAIANAHSIQPPARTLTRTPHPSFDPPAYDDLLNAPNISTNLTLTSVVSDTPAAAAAMSFTSSQSSNSN
ncbi:hypothetical protein BGX27_007328 [Mortierella sp. AM989]|nr:hypothetical protein BGX27_007328 [Mortierella sp. AM989]